jgi:hypothetical protein
MDRSTENKLFRNANEGLYWAKNGCGKLIKLAYEKRMLPKTKHYMKVQLERLLKLAWVVR